MMNAYDGNGGCGCGGGGGGCGGGCGGGAVRGNGVGAVRRSPDGFVRPRYFAGQLLTEDDLQALVDYLRGKRRLSNRMLFGAGVGTGLQVHCDPCDARRVVVQRGYAIDGMGNDLYLPCTESVDLVALARQVQADGGCDVDCEDEQGVARVYDLWMRYVELPEEPVVPHITDGTCSTSAPLPEATRVREAVRFALTCPADGCGDEPPPDPRIERMSAALGGITDMRATHGKLATVLQAFRDLGEDPWPHLRLILADERVAPRLPPLEGYPGGPPPPQIAGPIEALADDPDAVQVEKATVAMGYLLNRWYRLWDAVRRNGGLLPVDGRAELGADLLAWFALLDAWRDAGDVLQRVANALGEWHREVLLRQRAAFTALVTHLDDLSPEVDDHDPNDADQRRAAHEAWVVQLDARLASRPLAAQYPATRVLAHDIQWLPDVPDPNVDPAAAEDERARISGLLSAWYAWLGNIAGAMGCGSSMTTQTRCDDHRVPAGFLDFAVSPVGDLEETVTLLRRATEVIHGIVEGRLADAACDAMLTPVPCAHGQGVKLARVTLIACRVSHICAAGRPQLDTPVKRRLTEWSTRLEEWAACRMCCATVDAPAPDEGDIARWIEQGRRWAGPGELLTRAEVGERGDPIPPPGDGAGGDPPEEDPPGAGPDDGGAGVANFDDQQPVIGPVQLEAALAPLRAEIERLRAALDAQPAPALPVSRPALPPWDARMRKAQLIDVARAAGLKVDDSETKARIVERLQAVESQGGEA